MRLPHALLGAMRTWRADRAGLTEADRMVAGDRSGLGNPGLEYLLDAARGPGTTGETSGAQAMIAALAAERRRAVLTAIPKGSIRVQVPTSARTFVVSIAAGVVLLGVGGTAVAARTGSLPAGVQQHAHDLFPALGVPAPGTGPTTSPPAPTASAAGPTGPARPEPTPTPPATETSAPETSAPETSTPKRPRPTTPRPTATAPAEAPAWCEAWRVAAAGGHPMNGRARRDLNAAAGGADNVAEYCARLTGSASPAPTVTTKPGKGPKPGRGNQGRKK
ncbi:MAG: hypothetical protein ABW000_10160 [Actinoplanes sp.]